MPHQQLWEQACLHLRQVLQPDVFDRWIAIIHPLRIEENNLLLSVDNDFYQTWLEQNYLSLILDALRASGAPEDIEITFHISPSEEPPEPVQKKTRPRSRASVPRKTGSRKMASPPNLNEKFNFEQFVVGPSNSFAHAAALAVANAPARAYNPLFIYGETGLGKTHLMQAIGHCVYENDAHLNVSYQSSEALLNEYVTALQNRKIVEFRSKYRNTDVLLVDDIHFLAGKTSLQEEFFHTFNTLYDARKQIVMTSDRPAAEISGLEERLVSRFEWGLVTELEKPDFETRLAILHYKHRNAKVHLPDEILHFIAENIKSNVRRLEGALVRTVSYASFTREKLDLEATQRLLRDMLEQEAQDDLKFEDIQRTVAEHFDIRVADIRGKRRPRSIAMPRQIAMYLCRQLTRSSLPEIANSFGKTHATVLHACKAIHERMPIENSLRDDVRSIARKLGRDPYSFDP